MGDQINGKTITREQLEKAMACKNVDELLALAKAEGFGLTRDEAEAYISEMADGELDLAQLDKVAGGVCWKNCPGEGNCGHHVCGTVGWENFKGC